MKWSQGTSNINTRVHWKTLSNCTFSPGQLICSTHCTNTTYWCPVVFAHEAFKLSFTAKRSKMIKKIGLCLVEVDKKTSRPLWEFTVFYLSHVKKTHRLIQQQCAWEGSEGRVGGRLHTELKPSSPTKQWTNFKSVSLLQKENEKPAILSPL